MTMRALWLENGTLELRRNVDRPRRRAGEALIRVLQAGICNTDLELLRGYYGYTGIPGHEFVGEVEEGPDELCGQRVVGEINIACGDCSACRRGDRSHCLDRRVLGLRDHPGAFAELLTLPVENLHRVPDTVSTDAATFVEPLAAALEIQQQIEIRGEDRVVIVGDGKLGQLIAQTVALTGCRLLVVGRRQRAPDPLLARGIATGLAAEVETGSCDIAIECTGNPAGFGIARAALRPRGVLVLKSTYAGRLDLDLSSVVVDEITLIGSRCGPFEPALRLLADGLVDVGPLIAARRSLDEGPTAFDLAGQRGTLKVLLEIMDREGSEW